MTAVVSHIEALVELWSRRADPSAEDVRRAHEVAHALNGDPTSSTALRSLAWRVVGEIHDAAGWTPSPSDEPLPLCSSAAASVRHTNTLLIDEVLRELRSTDDPVLVTGALGASRTLFGRWDVLPASGALLVTLSDDDGPGTSLDASFRTRGVRWTAASTAIRELARGWETVTLRDRQVRVPSTELLAACAARTAIRAEDCETLVFCAAAHDASGSGRWEEIERLAALLDEAGTPTECALRLGLDRWLDLDLSSARRLGLSIKRLFVAPILRRHGTVPSDRLP